MKKESISKYLKSFEESKFEKDGIEIWCARDLQELLGYKEWRKFTGVIQKATNACDNAGHLISDHFVGADKMVELGSGAERQIEDVMLTRYACYLIAQNGDPRKQEIAFAQSYFALQTRKQELVEERIALMERFDARDKLTRSEKELSGLIFERGVDSGGFARIRSKGDEALFGEHNTRQMKVKLSIPFNRPLADFLPTVTIAAKNFATELTNFNVKKDDLHGETDITQEHIKNSSRIRNVMLESDIVPEELPPQEGIKKLERRVKKAEKGIESDIHRPLKDDE